MARSVLRLGIIVLSLIIVTGCGHMKRAMLGRPEPDSIPVFDLGKQPVIKTVISTRRDMADIWSDLRDEASAVKGDAVVFTSREQNGEGDRYTVVADIIRFQ